ncbi:hypothetical protein FACS1894170_02770 [Planctomycetales bacterium]|nr:hypothetical protein FACS1894170_02770 [Planctomycetales bacterium]
MSESSLTVENIDAAIADALAFQSMSVDGESTTNQSVASLMNVRKALQRESELDNGTRSTVARFNLSNQQF